MDSFEEPTVCLSPYAASTRDWELVEAILRRDRKATAEFVTLHTDTVYFYVRRRLLPRTDFIDDLVQDIFIVAWQQLPTYKGLSSLQGWLLGIARHKVDDFYRMRLRETSLLEEAGPLQGRSNHTTLRIDEVIDRKEIIENTHRILADLPEPYALALLWRYWEKRSTREMATLTGKTEKTIERLLSRAREQFRRTWKHGHPIAG